MLLLSVDIFFNVLILVIFYLFICFYLLGGFSGHRPDLYINDDSYNAAHQIAHDQDNAAHHIALDQDTLPKNHQSSSGKDKDIKGHLEIVKNLS